MLRVVQDSPQKQRINRKPVHSFQVKHRPWQIQPFMIAPVLPGETLDNLLLQSRVVTDPVKHPLLGWWIEHYVFYVKHRDLEARDDLTAMVLENASIADLHTGAKVSTYHYAGAVDWASLCLERVVEEYFRNQDEAWDAFTLDGLPVAAAVQNEGGIFDSAVIDATAPPAANDLQDPPDLTIMAAYQEQYDRMRQMRMTDMSYEDFLKTYGVRGVKETEDLHRPELLRYSRDWSYPTNTVDPVTGTPTSAVSWSIAERADKARMFKEPGFVFGVTVARPKVYLRNQRGSGVHALDTAMSWLPALLGNEPYTSIKEYVAANAVAGPLGVATNGYWLDVRDLFVYGDQFVNFAMAAGDGSVPLPKASLQKRYLVDADSAEVNAFFNGAANQVRQDGVVSLTIKSSLLAARDYT